MSVLQPPNSTLNKERTKGFEADLNNLIDEFVLQVVDGSAPLNYTAFKTLWKQKHMSFVIATPPSIESSPEHMQSIFMSILDRFDKPSPLQNREDVPNGFKKEQDNSNALGELLAHGPGDDCLTISEDALAYPELDATKSYELEDLLEDAFPTVFQLPDGSDFIDHNDMPALPVWDNDVDVGGDTKMLQGQNHKSGGETMLSVKEQMDSVVDCTGQMSAVEESLSMSLGISMMDTSVENAIKIGGNSHDIHDGLHLGSLQEAPEGHMVSKHLQHPGQDISADANKYSLGALIPLKDGQDQGTAVEHTTVLDSLDGDAGVSNIGTLETISVPVTQDGGQNLYSTGLLYVGNDHGCGAPAIGEALGQEDIILTRPPDWEAEVDLADVPRYLGVPHFERNLRLWVPFEAKIAALFALYTCYKVQIFEPKMHIHVPYSSLSELVTMLPELQFRGLWDACEMLKVLMEVINPIQSKERVKENAFVFGNYRRLTQSEDSPHESDGPEIEAGRELVFHLRTSLKGACNHSGIQLHSSRYRTAKNVLERIGKWTTGLIGRPNSSEEFFDCSIGDRLTRVIKAQQAILQECIADDDRYHRRRSDTAITSSHKRNLACLSKKGPLDPSECEVGPVHNVLGLERGRKRVEKNKGDNSEGGNNSKEVKSAAPESKKVRAPKKRKRKQALTAIEVEEMEMLKGLPPAAKRVVLRSLEKKRAASGNQGQERTSSPFCEEP